MALTKSTELSLSSDGPAEPSIARVERAPTFAGSLEAVSALDLLDWLCVNRKNWTLRLFSDGGQGYVVVVQGELLDARCGSLQGLPALAELVGYRRGSFDLAPVADTTHRSLRGHWRSLLLGAAQLADGQHEDEAARDAMAPEDWSLEAGVPSKGKDQG